MTGPAWTPEVFVDDNGYEPFTSFIESVPDFTFVALTLPSAWCSRFEGWNSQGRSG